MKILITGASGFIGKYVYEKLKKTEHDIFCTSRKKIKNWYKTDILNKSEVESIIINLKPDLLIHLAWDVTPGEFFFSEKNSEYENASKHLFDCFLKNGGKKIISTGTGAEYETSSKSVSEDDECDIEKLTPYGKAKRKTFNFLNNLTNNFTWIRIFGIFGKGESEKKFFPTAINKIQNKESIIFNNKSLFVDFVHVDDISNFIVAAIDNEFKGAINTGTGTSYALEDIFIMLKNYFNTQEFKISNTCKNPNELSMIPNCKKIKDYGYNFSLEKGFSKLYFEINNKIVNKK